MISWHKGWLLRCAAPCQARRSSTTSVCNSAGFINLDPPALLMNGLCVFLRLFWKVLATIKVYLPAVRSLHIEQGFPDPLVDCLWLQRVLRGIKGTLGDALSLRLPGTDDIMVAIFRALDMSLPDHCMFWAACNLAYFGFLHLLFTWVWPTSKWIRIHPLHVYGLGSRPLKQIRSARARASFLCVQSILCWLICL